MRDDKAPEGSRVLPGVVATAIVAFAAFTLACGGSGTRTDAPSQGAAASPAGGHGDEHAMEHDSEHAGKHEELPAAAVAEATSIFALRCTPCHGALGKGDGPASAGLTPKPRNFTEKTWQTSVTDEHIEQIIQYGGTAVGKAAMMPANPDLTSKPDVVKALRAHVRSLAE